MALQARGPLKLRPYPCNSRERAGTPARQRRASGVGRSVTAARVDTARVVPVSDRQHRHVSRPNSAQDAPGNESGGESEQPPPDPQTIKNDCGRSCHIRRQRHTVIRRRGTRPGEVWVSAPVRGTISRPVESDPKDAKKQNRRRENQTCEAHRKSAHRRTPISEARPTFHQASMAERRAGARPPVVTLVGIRRCWSSTTSPARPTTER